MKISDDRLSKLSCIVLSSASTDRSSRMNAHYLNLDA